MLRYAMLRKGSVPQIKGLDDRTMNWKIVLLLIEASAFLHLIIQ